MEFGPLRSARFAALITSPTALRKRRLVGYVSIGGCHMFWIASEHPLCCKGVVFIATVNLVLDAPIELLAQRPLLGFYSRAARPAVHRGNSLLGCSLHVSLHSSGRLQVRHCIHGAPHRCQALVILFLPLGEHPKSETANNKHLTPNLI